MDDIAKNAKKNKHSSLLVSAIVIFHFLCGLKHKKRKMAVWEKNSNQRKNGLQTYKNGIKSLTTKEKPALWAANNLSHREVLDSVLAGNFIDLKNQHPATNNNSLDSGVALWGVLTGCERWMFDVIEVS